MMFSQPGLRAGKRNAIRGQAARLARHEV